MLITAQLFTGTGWSDPTLVEEINTRNVMHDGKLYSYLFHKRLGQRKKPPTTQRVRISIAKKRPCTALQGHNTARTGQGKGRRFLGRKNALREVKKAALQETSPIVAAHSRCQKVRGPDGWVAGPFSEKERGMMDGIKGRKVKHNGRWWVCK